MMKISKKISKNFSKIKNSDICPNESYLKFNRKCQIIWNNPSM